MVGQLNHVVVLDACGDSEERPLGHELLALAPSKECGGQVRMSIEVEETVQLIRGVITVVKVYQIDPTIALVFLSILSSVQPGSKNFNLLSTDGLTKYIAVCLKIEIAQSATPIT